MTQAQIRKSLERVTGGQAFMTAAEVARAFGMKDGHYAKVRFLQGLEAVDGKYYLVAEVAEQVKKMCKA